MTGTPLLLADPPEPRVPAAPRADVLSEVLRAVRLSGSVFFEGSFSEPWGVVSPRRIDRNSPMARFRHFSVFHVIVSGECEIRTAEGEQRRVAAGDILLLPFPDEHRFWSGEPDRFAHYADMLQQSEIEGMATARWGGGGAETRFLCGYVESSELLFMPVFRSLPPLLVERTAEEPSGAMLTTLVGEIVRLVEAAAPGSQLLLGRMMELLFLEVLRRHVSRLPETASGWFAALRDPIAGRALQALHAEPARRWTVEQLADVASTSRTVLAERFKTLIGRPPMDYLASWRIQLAADMLRSGRDSIAQVAAKVGYESEPAFSRAFKRLTGASPGQWRTGSMAA